MSSLRQSVHTLVATGTLQPPWPPLPSSAGVPRPRPGPRVAVRLNRPAALYARVKPDGLEPSERLSLKWRCQGLRDDFRRARRNLAAVSSFVVFEYASADMIQGRGASAAERNLRERQHSELVGNHGSLRTPDPVGLVITVDSDLDASLIIRLAGTRDVQVDLSGDSRGGSQCRLWRAVLGEHRHVGDSRFTL